MASKGYPLGFKAHNDAGFTWTSANLKVAMINSATTYNSAHDYWNDVSAGQIGSSIALTSPALSVTGSTNLRFDAADTGLTWASVAAGSTIGAFVIYYDTGTPATSPLLVFLDVTDTPTNGGDVVLTFHANGIWNVEMA